VRVKVDLSCSLELKDMCYELGTFLECWLYSRRYARFSSPTLYLVEVEGEVMEYCPSVAF